MQWEGSSATCAAPPCSLLTIRTAASAIPPGRIPCNAARGAAARPPPQGRQPGRNLNARGAGPRRGMPCRRAPARGPARPEA